jgi:hypothetical protein
MEQDPNWLTEEVVDAILFDIQLMEAFKKL